MANLIRDYAFSFKRDVKALLKKHRDTSDLKEVIELVLQNTETAKKVLRQKHNAHALKGAWLGSNECHIANAGDWLLIWRTGNGIAVFQRTGTHDELFQ